MVSRSQIFGHAAVAACLVGAGLSPVAAQRSLIDFGDDTGIYARDGDCDDMRFVGRGVSSALLVDNIGRDATDCRAALRKGTVSLNPLFIRPDSTAEIIFGDDASDYARDGDCDDVRFVGARSAETIYLDEDVGHDASDCRAGVNAGTLRWQGDLVNPVRGLSSSELGWADQF